MTRSTRPIAARCCARARSAASGRRRTRRTRNFSDTLLPALAGPSIGNCSSANGNQTSLAPPRYASCTPPQGSTQFSQDEWTTVVNEILAEAFAADQAVGFFAVLGDMRDGLYLQENAELPAIGSDLEHGAGGAPCSRSTARSPPTRPGSTGIAASIAGLAPGGRPGGQRGPLGGVGDPSSMVPQTSPTATTEHVHVDL